MFEDAITEVYKSIICETGKSISDTLSEYNLESSVIMVNGRFVGSDYILKDNDIVTIRIYPEGLLKSIKSSIRRVGNAFRNGVNFVADKFSTFCSFIKGKVADFVKWAIGDDELEETESDDELKDNPVISGQQNQSAKNKAIPIILGETLITPGIIGDPYTKVKFDANGYGTKQEFHALYILGWNDIEATDFRLKYSNLATNYASKGDIVHSKVKNGKIPIDGTSFKSFGNLIDLEIRNVGEVQNYSQKIAQENENIQLMRPIGTSVEDGTLLPTERFSKSYPMRVEIEVGFQGLYKVNKNTGNKETTSVACHFQYSFDEVTWHNMTGVLGTGAVYSNGLVSFTANQNQTLRYIIYKDFTYNELKGMIEDGKTNFIYLRSWRESFDAIDSPTCDKVYLMATRTFCFDKDASKEKKELVAQIPFNATYRDMTTRVGLCIESSESLKENINALNCTVRSRSPIWNGSEWGESDVTSNPASLAYMLFTHNALGNYKYGSDKFDAEKFGEFYEYCEECGFECNNAVSNVTKFGDVITKILDCGHAYPIPIDNKYSVFIDKPQSVPSVILNNHNILQEGLSNSKSFDEMYDGLEITFINKNLDYRQDVIRCMYDSTRSKDETAKLQKVTYNYVSTPELVWRKGKYDLLKQKYRPEMWNRRVGLEGVLCSVGSLIEIQDDTILVGIGDGGCITDLSYNETMTAITGFRIDGEIPFTDTDKNYALKIIKYSNDWELPKVGVYLLDINEVGIYKDFVFKVPVSLDEYVIPEIDDICSFGEYNRETTKCLCINKKPVDGWTYDLTLVPYDDNVYIYDTKDTSKWTEQLPDFDSKVTLPSPFVSPNEVPFDYIKRDEFSTTITELTYGGEAVGKPDAPVITSAVAYEKYVRIDFTFSKYGIKNTVKTFVVEISKDGGETFELAGKTKDFQFDYSIEGLYLESEDFEDWKFRMYAVSIYGKTDLQTDDFASDFSNVVSVDTHVKNIYGTWKLNAPDVLTRVSDRTITLINSQPQRSDKKSIYGNIKYKISVKRNNDNPEFQDDQWYKPATSTNPYAGQDNYKEIDSEVDYIISDNVYTQCMPLLDIDGKGIGDTNYSFRIVAFNESDESIPTIINENALCTSIRDIVKANETSKSAYISELSAISANIGVISQGGLTSDNDQNYWALSNIENEKGEYKKGAFRVGGKEQYLKVVPYGEDPTTGDPLYYEIEFKVGNFQVSTTATSLSGDLILQQDDNALDRAYVAPNKIALQHRNSVNSSWYDITTMDTSGITGISYRSKDDIIIGNFTQTKQRQLGHDIGRPYLTENAKVWHFDDDFKCNDGTSGGLVLSGTYKLRGVVDNSILRNNFDYTPAVLNVAPYCNNAKSATGMFSMKKKVENSEKLTVDFWMQYPYAENQTLFSIGTTNDVIKLQIAPEEPVAVVSGSCVWRAKNEGTIYTASRNPTVNAGYYDIDPDDFDVQESGKIASIKVDSNFLVTSVITDTGVEYMFDSGNADFNWEIYAPEDVWGATSSLANRAKPGQKEIIHDGQASSESIPLESVGKEFNSYEWSHIAVVFTQRKIKFLYMSVNDETDEVGTVEFDKYGSASDDFDMVLNGSEGSILIDELYIDSDEEYEGNFLEQTKKRYPWGALDCNEKKWFVFDAEDPSKVRSNILDWFRSELLASDDFKNKVKAIISEV